ncbi:hypothetical protein O181_023868 [Austropuccinia psidii MF-1]|uniref:Uncharacterized protein n=1 Tax=Austropuccinia psidii MF-1 TaxID=1389203 RepID=A0A9Q3CJM7_9BASI|nr:hypothetical protein [Austropuccinia psidii MF-1]
MESAKQDLSFRNEFAPQNFLNEIDGIPMPHSQDDEELNSNGEDHEPKTHGTLNSNIICTFSLIKENFCKAREMLIHIIHCFTHEGIPNNNLLSNIPHDICTISKQLKLESPFEQHPTISSKPCITEPFNTFKVYPLPHLQLSPTNPTLTNQGQKLGEVHLKGQKPHRISQERFFSQSLLEWIKWFLNIPGIEQGIEDWAYELSTHQSIAVCNVGQVSVWKDLFLPPSANHPLELGLSLFVYWFNPKGKNISAGVIPSPKQPEMVTINNVLKLLIDELIELNCGVKVVTPNHPRERYVVVKLVGLIGEIVATHKAGGFMSHLAK